MPRVPCWPALFLLPVFVALAQNPPRIGIFMQFDAAPATALLNTMETEVRELLKASGVSLDWRLASRNQGREAFSRLVVLKFKGSCRAEPGSAGDTDFGSLGSANALGYTRVSHGEVLPFSEVRCDEVRKALAFLHPGANHKERQAAMGLALGRVVAHELYHMLARNTAHASRGLAKATHSLADLVSDQPLELDAEDSGAIRKAVAGAGKKSGTDEAPRSSARPGAGGMQLRY